MKCKYLDKDCEDRYFSSYRGHCCRLVEWKKRLKVCPYNSNIKSCSRRDIRQAILEVKA